MQWAESNKLVTRKLRGLAPLTCSLVGLTAVILTSGTLVIHALMGGFSASALTESSSGIVEGTAGNADGGIPYSITLTLGSEYTEGLCTSKSVNDDPINLTLNLNSDSNLYTTCINAHVVTTDPFGYTLSAHTVHSDLIHHQDSNMRIPSTQGTLTTPIPLTTVPNTWGFCIPQELTQNAQGLGTPLGFNSGLTTACGTTDGQATSNTHPRLHPR